MKIHSLDIQNFGPFGAYHVDLDARPLFVGPNGRGKTTIQDAISWCLTGRCTGVNEKGEGQKDLIKHGAESGRVTLVLEVSRNGQPRQATISRVIDGNGSKCNATQETIHESLRTTPAVLRAALQASKFFDLDHASARALLLDVIAVTIPPSALPASLGVTEAMTIPQLEALYQKTFEERRVVQRQFDALPSAGVSTEGAGPVEFMPGQAARALAVWNEKRAAATVDLKHAAALAKSIDDLGGAQSRLRVAVKNRDEYTRELEQLTKERDRAQQMIDEDPPADLTRLTAGADVKVAEVKRMLIPLRAFNASETVGNSCVLGGGIPCHTPASAFAEQIAELTALQTRLAAGLDAFKDRQKAIERAQRVLGASNARLGDVRASLTFTADADASIALNEYRLGELRGEYDRAVVTSAASSEAAQQAENFYMLARDAETRALAVDSIRQAAERRVTLGERLAELEIQLSALGPTGVRVAALQDRLRDFTALINRGLVPWGFTLAFQLNPWQVVVSGHDGLSTRFVKLSRGERLRVATAFQLALVEVAGLSFMCIDDLDALDPAGRSTFTALVKGAAIDQVVMAQMRAEGDVPRVRGIQVLELPAPVSLTT